MTRFQVDLVGHRGDCWRLDTEEEVIQEIKKRYPDAILARDYQFRGSTARGDKSSIACSGETPSMPTWATRL